MASSLSYPSRPAWQRTRAIMRLVRPLNVLLFMGGVVVGGLLAAGLGAFREPSAVRLLLAALSAALIGGAANSINDVFDLEIDRINRPGRPLPAGQLAPQNARMVWAVASAAGVALSFWLSGMHVLLALASVALLYLYSAYLKRTVLAGNLVVALVTALALIYGGWAVGSPGPAFVGAAFAFLTSLAREVVKDVEDLVGDDAAEARTLPIVYGSRRAVQVVTVVLALTILLTPIPYLLLDYGGLFLILVLITDTLLLRALWVLQGPHPEVEAAHASLLLKGAMVAGMCALALAWVTA